MDVLALDTFVLWLRRLRDVRAQERVAQRIARLRSGLLGDIKPVGGGVSALRIDYGLGYRLYVALRGDALIVLLHGGDKSSQQRDVAKAQAILIDWEQSRAT